jgi:hypothetical protein
MLRVFQTRIKTPLRKEVFPKQKEIKLDKITSIAHRTIIAIITTITIAVYAVIT